MNRSLKRWLVALTAIAAGWGIFGAANPAGAEQATSAPAASVPVSSIVQPGPRIQPMDWWWY
jgi:hypothetical protein